MAVPINFVALCIIFFELIKIKLKIHDLEFSDFTSVFVFIDWVIEKKLIPKNDILAAQGLNFTTLKNLKGTPSLDAALFQGLARSGGFYGIPRAVIGWRKSRRRYGAPLFARFTFHCESTVRDFPKSLRRLPKVLEY